MKNSPSQGNVPQQRYERFYMYTSFVSLLQNVPSRDGELFINFLIKLQFYRITVFYFSTCASHRQIIY